jgi:hypothetical protein
MVGKLLLFESTMVCAGDGAFVSVAAFEDGKGDFYGT